jgi:hypothetical protein
MERSKGQSPDLALWSPLRCAGGDTAGPDVGDPGRAAIGGNCERQQEHPPQRGSASQVTAAAKQLAGALSHRHARKENPHEPVRDGTSPRRIRPGRPGQRLRKAARPLRPRAVAVRQQLGSLGPILRGCRLRRGQTKSLHDPESVARCASIRRRSHTRASPTSRPTSRRSSKGSIASLPSSATPFGGLLVQILAGRGLAAVSIAIDATPPEACSHGRWP